MRKTSLLLGFGAGYVLGARAGRERYEQIVRQFKSLKDNPTVQEKAGQLQSQATDLASQAKDKVQSRKQDDASGTDTASTYGTGTGNASTYDVVEVPATGAPAGDVPLGTDVPVGSDTSLGTDGRVGI